MKPSLVFTLVMLFLMAVAGVVGVGLGSALGRDALSGVTQPDFGLSSRTAGQGDTAPEPAPGQAIAFVSEQTILDQVKARVTSRKGTPPTPIPPAPVSVSADPSETSSSKATPQKQVGFPIASQDGGVLMEVTGAKPDGGALVFEVTLRNEGTKSVRFLYSFLDVTDNQGRPLSATTDGLPGELLPLSDTFAGSIRIPRALLEGVEQITISLTDYPDQKLKLKLSSIPVLNDVSQ